MAAPPVAALHCRIPRRRCRAPSPPLAALPAPGQQPGERAPVFFSTNTCRRGEQPLSRNSLAQSTTRTATAQGRAAWGSEPGDVLKPTNSVTPTSPSDSRLPPTAGLSQLKTCGLSLEGCLRNIPNFRWSQLVCFHSFTLQKAFGFSFFFVFCFTSAVKHFSSCIYCRGTSKSYVPRPKLTVLKSCTPPPGEATVPSVVHHFFLTGCWLCFLQKTSVWSLY